MIAAGFPLLVSTALPSRARRESAAAGALLNSRIDKNSIFASICQNDSVLTDNCQTLYNIGVMAVSLIPYRSANA
jgi:hypothetical protein